MPYWEWEMYRKHCEEIAEEERKQQEEQQKGHRSNPYTRQAQRMMNGYGNGYGSMPRMPNMPSGMRAPSIPSMPKI